MFGQLAGSDFSGRLACQTSTRGKKCSRKDTPTEGRVSVAWVYQHGLSYQEVAGWIGQSHQAVHDWYGELADLFEPEYDRHRIIVVDETKVRVEDEEVYVWATVNLPMFEVIHVEGSPGRSEPGYSAVPPNGLRTNPR